MKNIATLLSKGNLTPKQRVLLWVANQVSEDRDGKQILTEADKYALIQGWRPNDNSEIKEYNRYNDGWEAIIFAETDAQGARLKAEVGLLRASKLIDYVLLAKGENLITLSETIFEDLDANQDDALDLVLNNSGLTFDDVVYRSAFASLNEGMRHDILALCPDAETENQYLDQEEVIADLFNGKDVLTKEAKEKLADTMVDAMANKHADYFRAKGLSGEDWWFDGYYGDIPTIEIIKKWAEYHNVDYEVDDRELEKAAKAQAKAEKASDLIVSDIGLDPEVRKDQLRKKVLTEKIKEGAEKSGVGIGELLRQTILKWLDEGLFEECVPLCISGEKNTCNDVDTKLPHKEVFAAWLAAKAEAKTFLQKLIDNGELKIEQRHKKFLGEPQIVNIITGQSLYHFKGDLACTKDFQKQVDDMKPFGCLMVFLREHHFIKNYALLLGFNEIFERLSKTYETDLGYPTRNMISSFQKDIQQLNAELRYVAERTDGALYIKDDVDFPIEVFIEDMIIDPTAIKPGTDGIVKKYHDKFQEILGDDF